MIIPLKIAAGTAIGLAILGPGFTPRADDCQCKAKAGATWMVPRADDCQCKAKANALSFVPRADDCECKAKADK
jgi:hypothetical protein